MLGAIVTLSLIIPLWWARSPAPVVRGAEARRGPLVIEVATNGRVEPIEGEDIHLWASLPMEAEEQLTVQDRIVAIEQSVQEKYDVQTVVVALPESE